MNKLSCFLSIPLCLCLNLSELDKRQHFTGSIVLSTVANSHLQARDDITTGERLGYSVALAMVPGILKEVVDSYEYQNHYDQNDLTADLAGALVGVGISEFFHSQILIGNYKDGFKIRYLKTF